MIKTISILGCGWLGTALGKRLLAKGYAVKGSTSSAEKYVALEFTGIETYHLKVEPDAVIVDYNSFFNTDVLVIMIPPKRIENITDVYPQQIDQIGRLVQSLKVKRVIFVSSTSVYAPENKVVKEGDTGIPSKPNGKAILAAEKLLQKIPDVQTTVVRFGGLIGFDRNPARFLSGKKNVPGDSPVNLIHREDAVRILIQVIEKQAWGEVFNACCPEHPTKKEFYSRAAKISELPAPEFFNDPERFKIVNSDKLIQQLSYEFEYPGPMDYLKEWQEWIYRI